MEETHIKKLTHKGRKSTGWEPFDLSAPRSYPARLSYESGPAHLLGAGFPENRRSRRKPCKGAAMSLSSFLALSIGGTNRIGLGAGTEEKRSAYQRFGSGHRLPNATISPEVLKVALK